MIPAIKIVIDPVTGTLDKIELVAPDKKSRSQAFFAYQVIEDEVKRFAEKVGNVSST